MAHQTAVERGDRDRVLDQCATIGRAQLQRRMIERRPDRPPDVARIVDHAGAHHRGNIGIELLLGAKQRRHTRARQLVIGGQPIALEPGAARLPERRGGRQRQKQRQKGDHAAHHVDPAVGVRHFDMHVHAAQHVASPDHLQIVHDGNVALLLGLHRSGPQRGRMSAGGENGEAVLGRDCGHDLAQLAQLGAGVGRVGVRRGDDLDLGLQEFARHPAVGRRLGCLEKGLRHAPQHQLGLGVDQEIFFLDPERVGIRHGRAARTTEIWAGCIRHARFLCFLGSTRAHLTRREHPSTPYRNFGFGKDSTMITMD